jgi:co-chaperonin GroES (HSP10)
MAGNKMDKLVRGMKARTNWVLLVTEDTGTDTAGGVIQLAHAMKTPFSRVLSVGPDVEPTTCQVGDRVIFREGMGVNRKDEVRFTVDTYLFVHKTNILGVAPEESLQAGTPVEETNGASGETVEAAP